MSSSPVANIGSENEGQLAGIMFGRFMLPDLSEHPCQVTNLTVHGATFVTPRTPPEGQAVVAYLEDVGRIEAVTGPAKSGSFEVTFSLKGPRLERLQQRIEWLKQRKVGDTSDNRRHARYEPSEKVSQITLPDGRVYNCEVLDISVSGAGIKTEVVPSIGTFLMLGKMRGRVVRYLDQGVAIEFVKQLEGTQLPSVKSTAPLSA